MMIPKPWRDPILKGRVLVISPFEASHRQPKVQLASRRNRLVSLLASTISSHMPQPEAKTERFSVELIRLGVKATSVTELIRELKRTSAS
jgi:hypothetical protein